jgi:flagellar motor switch protein FliG
MSAVIRSRITFLILAAAGFLYAPLLPSQQRADESQVETALQQKLQSMLDVLVGPQRTIVDVDVTLRDTATANEVSNRVRAMTSLSGVRTSVKKEEAGAADGDLLEPLISSRHISVQADEKLAAELIEKIKTEVPKWARINPGRGDTFKLELIPWREIVSPPSATQQNYLLYSILAMVVLLILIAAIYFPLRKLKMPETTPPGAIPGTPAAPRGPGEEAAGGPGEEEKRKQRTEELDELKQVFAGAANIDQSGVLEEIRNMIEKGLSRTPAQIDSILEEIKDILSKTPQESDTLLTEIRDTLADMLDAQKKLTAMGGLGAGTGTGAAAPGAAPAAAPAARAEAAGRAAGDGGFGPEVVEVLGNIEDLMAQQLEKTPESGILDEPFKYLKTLPPEDVVMLVEDEEPKLAAAVLSQIDSKSAADVMAGIEEEKQFEIARAMTGLVETEDLAEEIKDFLERKLKIVRLHKDYIPVLGYRVLADILSSSRYAVARVLLDKMESKNPAMAAEVRKRMFLFEDVVTLTDKDLEALIHNLPREMVSCALADSPEEIRNKFLQNMTERARQMIQEDMETLKKVQLEKDGKEMNFNEAMLALDQNVIEEIFRTVDRNVVKMALRGGSDEVREKFFAGLTERAVVMLKEDLEVMGQITRKRADEAQEEVMNVLRKLSSKTLEAQHEIIATIRKLEKEGQISVERFQEEMV